jgi:hypothetical protein
MSKNIAVIGILCALVPFISAAENPDGNLYFRTVPYIESGLFISPPIPQEGETVVLTVRAETGGLEGEEKGLEELTARISIRFDGPGRGGSVVADRVLNLSSAGNGIWEGTTEWRPQKNGLYTAEAVIDPDNRIEETNETDNRAVLDIPVVAAGKDLHFVWYRVPKYDFRYVSCITSTDGPVRARLAERGIKALRWTYGGASIKHDESRAEEQPEEVLADIEDDLYRRYTAPEEAIGFGIDECGGYPGTFAVDKSEAAMKALRGARKERPDLYYAVWNSGGLLPELGACYREAADLLLLETYIWSAVPDDLGTEEVYQLIRNRIDPFVRSSDMIVPAYGNPCYTLIALDIYDDLDTMTAGEQEKVIRFIRSFCPEMRGIAWYNGSYTPESETEEEHYTALLRNAEDLFFKYFIRPCVTILPGGIWLDNADSGSTDRDKSDGDKGGSGTRAGKKKVTVAVSNIGGMDSEYVTVTLYTDGVKTGQRRIETVPAGLNRNETRVFVDFVLPYLSGMHTFRAEISDSPGNTVLDGTAKLDVYVQ